MAWQEDGRRERELAWTEGFGGEECVRRRDHYGEVVWHSLHTGGRIRVARVPPPPVSPPAPPPLESAPTDDRFARFVTAPPVDYCRPWAWSRPSSVRAVPDVGWRALARAVLGGPAPALPHQPMHGRRRARARRFLPLLLRCLRVRLLGCHRPRREHVAVSVVVDPETGRRSPRQRKVRALLRLRVDGRHRPPERHLRVEPPRNAPIYSSTAAATSTPDQLWAHLRSAGQRCLTIPHHPGSAMVPFDWSYHADDLQRLVEVFQACRGNYEDDGCFRQTPMARLPGRLWATGCDRGTVSG